ncbi:Rha family transcriptional regulator [Listeria booriae]|uniref:Rha family transcriptional regulator n=1 Tax=Listeria booriae TaxID=1552123 RepID=UPI00162A6696|nr:Rha family transcriptional regulator [Listeria booriae]MBC2103993.1 phage regulatory protein [Listeria booriae]
MTNLVVMKNQQAVTSSLQVAENFEKEHRVVLKAIDDLKEGLAQKYADLFYEDSYVHPQNKQTYRLIYMNRDGFTLAVLGFNNTRKVLDFKLRYIEAFNAMEAELKRPKSALDLMELTVQELRRHDGELRELNAKVDTLIDTTLATPQQLFQLAEAAKQRMIELCGAKYHKYANRLYPSLWSAYNNHFKLPSRNFTRAADFRDGLKFIANWEPRHKIKKALAPTRAVKHIKPVQMILNENYKQSK